MRKQEKNKSKSMETLIREMNQDYTLNEDEDDEEDVDIDIYGSENPEESDDLEGDVETFDLDDDESDIDDIDDTDISDDDDSLYGQSVSTDDEEDEGDVGDIANEIRNLVDRLQELAGGDEEDLEDEDDLDLDDEEMDLEDEESEEDLEDEDDLDLDDEDELNESNGGLDGKMQTLSVPAGMDNRRQEIIKDPSVSKSTTKAKALPKGKKPSGEEGNFEPNQVFDQNVKGDDAVSKVTGDPQISPNKARAVMDVVNSMLKTDDKVIDALFKGKSNKTQTMESVDFNMSDEMERFAEVDESLSPEFLAAAAQLMEAKLKSIVEAVIDNTEARYALFVSEELERSEAALVEKVDAYLGYLSDQYFEENALAIEEGVNQELTESLIKGITGVLEEHHIEVPKGKKNLLEEAKKELKEARSEQKEAMTKAVMVHKENASLRRRLALMEESENLVESQKEKFESLTESVEFKNEKQFKNEIRKIRESTFKKPQTKRSTTFMAESYVEQDEGKHINNEMSSYLNALSRTSK